MRNFLLPVMVLCSSTLYFSQSGNVGINTNEPKSTLDINGNLKVRTAVPITTATSDHSVLLRDKSTTGDSEVKEISVSNLMNSGSSLSKYSARRSGNWSLLSVDLGGSTYAIDLSGTHTRIGNSTLFNDGVYTAPVSGVYDVTYEIQLEGVNASVLGGSNMVIFKNTTVWENKPSDGVTVTLPFPLNDVLTVPITSTTISTLVQLNAGETLTFAINTNGLLPILLGVLPVNYVSLKVFKVAD